MDLSRILIISCGLWIAGCLSSIGLFAEDAAKGPIKALIITGGAIHDYESQSRILTAGIEERVSREIRWTIEQDGLGVSDEQIGLFGNADWAKDFDIVIHNYCFPRVTNSDYVEKIIKPHDEGKPAMLLHSAMHSFRVPSDRWFQFCGVQSEAHDPDASFGLEWMRPDHEILEGLVPWKIDSDELYHVKKIWPGVTGLADAQSVLSGQRHPVAWSHEYGSADARVFATSVGSRIESMMQPQYLDLVTRGFLWALDSLSDENFISVPSEDSLSSLSLELPKLQLPKPGSTAALNAGVRVVSLPSQPHVGVEQMVDGNPATSWGATGSGPFSIELSFHSESTVGAIAVVWGQERSPSHFDVEGLGEEGKWEKLTSGNGDDQVGGLSIHPVAHQKLNSLRLNFNEGPGPEPLKIREIAVYPSMNSVPAAMILARDAPKQGNEDAGIHQADDVKLPSGDWHIKAIEKDSSIYRFRQLAGTAAGGVWALMENRNIGEPGAVHFISETETGKVTRKVFLNDVPDGSAIAWDGEWIYLLSNKVQPGDAVAEGTLQLSVLRDTDGDLRADERYWRGGLKQDGKSSGLTGFDVVDFMIGSDMSYYAILSDQRNRENGNVSPQAHDRYRSDRLIRFGRDLEVDQILEAAPGVLLQIMHDDDGGVLVRAKQDDQDVSQVYRSSLIPNTKLKNLELAEVSNEKGEALFFAQMVVEDGQGRRWVIERDEGQGSLSLVSRRNQIGPRVEWDLIPDRKISSYYEHFSPVVRLEAPLELLRRKRAPEYLRKAPESGVGTSPAIELGWLRAHLISEADSELNFILSGLESEHPQTRALAFTALGDRVDSKNHPAYQKIETERIPIVTAAILGAMARSGSEMKGLNEFVLQLVAHSVPELKAAARSFLLGRNHFQFCLRVLDDESKLHLWPAALDLLSRGHDIRGVEGIIDRLKKSQSVKLQRIGIQTLCSLYYIDENRTKRWAGTDVVSDYFETIMGRPETDLAFLLSAMRAEGIQPEALEQLVAVASEQIAIEPEVIRILEGGTAPPSAKAWLIRLSKDEHRDLNLRVRALALLARFESVVLSKGVFGAFVKLDQLKIERTNLQRFENAWLDNSIHAENVKWLIEQAKKDDLVGSTLAWRTLLRTGSSQAENQEILAQVQVAVESVQETPDRLIDALEASDSMLEREFLSGMMSGIAEGSELHDLMNRMLVHPISEVSGAIGNMKSGQLIAAIAEVDGNVKMGKTLFQSSGCASCHNIHGEGPVYAPDLSVSVVRMNDAALIDSMLMPEKNSAEDAQVWILELDDGRQVRGMIRSRSDVALTLFDTGGNLVDVPLGKIEREWKSDEPIMSHQILSGINIEEMASLLAFLKSLGKAED